MTIDLYDDEKPAAYKVGTYHMLDWTERALHLDSFGAMSADPGLGVLYPGGNWFSFNEYLTIQAGQFTRPFFDKHMFIGFPSKHLTYYVGTSEGRHIWIVFRPKNRRARAGGNMDGVDKWRERMRRFRGFFCFGCSQIEGKNVISGGPFSYGDADVATLVQGHVILSVAQVDRLNDILMGGYDTFAKDNEWGDDFFERHEPYSVTLKYGQDNPIAEAYEEWEKMKSAWDRLYDCSKIGRFVCALAMVQKVKNEDGEECGVLCDYEAMKKEFRGREHGGQGASFYPLGFSKTACNVQANSLPNYFGVELERLNEKYSVNTTNEEGEVVRGPPPFQVIKHQTYSAQKSVFRNSKAEHEISLGREPAVLAMIGTTGAHQEKVQKELRALQLELSYDRTAKRIIQGTGSLGIRSEMEILVHPGRLAEYNRHGSFLVSKLLKPMTRLYFGGDSASLFQASLIVLRPHVYPSLLLDTSFFWAVKARRLWGEAMVITKNGQRLCPWYIIEGIAICLRNAAFAQTGDMRLISGPVFKAAGLWQSIIDTGVPTMTKKFWREGAHGHLNAEAWPQPQNGSLRPSVAITAVKAHFGKEAAEMYHRRFELEWRMDRLLDLGNTESKRMHRIAARQIVAAYRQEIRERAGTATHKLITEEEKQLNREAAHLERVRMMQVRERRTRALESWQDKDTPLDRLNGFTLVSRMLGSSETVPAFPLSNSVPRMESGTMVDRMLKMAENKMATGAPYFGSRSTLTMSLVQAALSHFTMGVPEELNVQHVRWLAEEVIKELQAAKVDIVPWTSKRGRHARGSMWVHVVHTSPYRAGVSTGRYLPANEDEYIAMKMEEQREKDNPVPHGWLAQMPESLWSIKLGHRDLSEEMDDGFMNLAKGGGIDAQKPDFVGLFGHLRALFEDGIGSDLHQYILFCATLLCKIHPHYRYVVSNPNAQLQDVEDARLVVRNMVMVEPTKKAGSANRGIIAASFIAWLMYKRYLEPSALERRWHLTEAKLKKKTGNHDLTWGLFTRWGFYTIVNPHQFMIQNKGPPEMQSNGRMYWRMTDDADLIEVWRTIKDAWKRGQYREALRTIWSEPDLKRWERRGLLEPPAGETTGGSRDESPSKKRPAVAHEEDLRRTIKRMHSMRVEFHPRRV
ncbi:hypothetical protein CALVIDRAFT_561148 [Calocera viscosa TUFC12733]|uniref:Uncharacterized protein n=1 Tax=Calocera viscosa (strain TUFC12733) TaxID=1330018 RepID=A0A167PZ94_CALVF|nr:hypothetical protein CALVIDRAFT_561148 [Calocera viscosa TUFC12733]